MWKVEAGCDDNIKKPKKIMHVMEKHIEKVVFVCFISVVATLNLWFQNQFQSQVVHRQGYVRKEFQVEWRGKTSHSDCHNATRRDFWRFVDMTHPGLYDAFVGDGTAYFIFNVKDGMCLQPASLWFSSLWVCHFGEIQHKARMVQDPHEHTLILSCPLPDALHGFVTTASISVVSTVGVYNYTDVRLCGTRGSVEYTLAACTMVRSELQHSLDFLLEWVAYHKLQGFEHFTIYPDEDPEFLRSALHPWIDEGFVDVVDWEWPTPGFQNQQAQQNSCLYRYRGVAKWVGLHDIDEFFQPLTAGKTVSEIVGEQDEQVGAIQVESMWFAPCAGCGFATPLIGQFTLRGSDVVHNERQKCIGRPENIDAFSVHMVTAGKPMIWVNVSGLLRLNHYRTPSLFELVDPVADFSMSGYVEAVKVELARVKNGMQVEKQTGDQTFNLTKSLKKTPSLQRLPDLKLLSYSLYGDNPRYLDGALANARLVSEYFPGWTMRVYHDNSVPEAVLWDLRGHSVQLVNMSASGLQNQMTWRFLPAGEAGVDLFASRDIDARLSRREAAAVREWEESGLPFHVMRDHPSHVNFAVSGGMWGSKGGAVKDIQHRLQSSALENEYIVDMNFLESQIWPLMNEAGVMVHDSFGCDQVGVRPFPTPRKGSEHVGSVYIDGEVRQVDADILMNALAMGYGCAPLQGTVAVRFSGRLGNQLFQAASSYGIAFAHHSLWCLPDLPGSILAESVVFLVQPAQCQTDGFSVESERGVYLEFNASMMLGTGDVLVGEYLQSYKYFSLSSIPFELKSRAFGQEWVAQRGIQVGIHVRRTDQLHPGRGVKDPGVGYYETVLAMLRKTLGGNVTAVVCTDDVQWVRAQRVFDGMHIRDGTDPPFVDMGILAACRHMVMSIGTFGWWAAYLRPEIGETFYYAEPFGRDMRYDDHFLTYWTAVSDQDIASYYAYSRAL